MSLLRHDELKVNMHQYANSCSYWCSCVYLNVLSIQCIKVGLHDSGEHTSFQIKGNMACNALVLLFIIEHSARDYLFSHNYLWNEFNNSEESPANNWLSHPKAKQINILGSRQHLAEKVALWCEFLFFIFLARVESRYFYVCKCAFNGVWPI